MAKRNLDVPPPVNPENSGGDDSQRLRNWVLTLLDELAKAREHRLQEVAAELRALFEGQQPALTRLTGGLDWLHEQVPGIQGEIKELQKRTANLAQGGADESLLKTKIDLALEPLEQRLLSAVKSVQRENETERTAILNFKKQLNELQNQIQNLPTGGGGLDDNSVAEKIKTALEPLENRLLAATKALQREFENDRPAIIKLKESLAELRLEVEKLPTISGGGLDEKQVDEKVKSLLEPALERALSAVKAVQREFENDRPAIIKLKESLAELRSQVEKLPKNEGGLNEKAVEEKIKSLIEPVEDRLQSAILAIQRQFENDRPAIIKLMRSFDEFKKEPLPLNWVNEILGLISAAIGKTETRLSNFENKIYSEILPRLDADIAELNRKLREEFMNSSQIEAWFLRKRGEIENWAIGKIGEEADLRRALEAAIKARIDALPEAEHLRKILAAVREDLKIWLDKTDQTASDLDVLEEKFEADHAILLETKSGLADLKETVGKLPDKKFVEDEIAEASKNLSEAMEERVKNAEKAAADRLDPLELFKTAATDRLSGHDKLIAELQDQIARDDASETGIRFARICLMGRGIVGGLEVKSEENATLCVSKGLGLAPNGELFVSERDRHFTHYQKFSPGSKIPFLQKPISPPNPEPQTYEAWVLLEKTGDSPEIQPLTPQKLSDLEEPFIADKVLLALPLEGRPHFLLMNRADAAARLQAERALRFQLGDNPEADFIFEEEFSDDDEIPTDEDLYQALNPAFSLPEIPLFRFGFWQEKDCDPADLDNTDFPDIKSFADIYETWLPIVSDALERMDKTLEKLTTRYHHLFFPQLPQADFAAAREQILSKWTKFKDQNASVTPGSGNDTRHFVQYFYDWARDLISAWHELRAELLELVAELRLLTPQQLQMQFNHLLLGPAFREIQTGLAAPLRDEFVQPPIYNGNAARLEKCRLYYRRLFALAEAFYLENYVAAPNLLPLENEPFPDFSRLRITPSRGYGFLLSEQAMPFYYPLTTSQLSPHRFWNYHRSKSLTLDMILSYHASDSDESYTARPEVIRPLYYSLDKADFYRIEGFIGKSRVPIYLKTEDRQWVDDFPVFDAVQYLVRKYNLDFAVRKITLGNDVLTQLFALSPSSPPEQARAFSELLGILGAEHLAGVPKGGTFLLVFDVNGKALADFALPYRLP